MKQFDFENINQKRDFYLNKQEKKNFHALTKGPGFYVIKNFHSKSKIKKAYNIVDKMVMNDKKIKSNASFLQEIKNLIKNGYIHY